MSSADAGNVAASSASACTVSFSALAMFWFRAKSPSRVKPIRFPRPNKTRAYKGRSPSESRPFNIGKSSARFGIVEPESTSVRADSTTGTGEVCTPEPNRTDPELIKTFGDLISGTKLAYPVAPGFSAGGEFGLRTSSITGFRLLPAQPRCGSTPSAPTIQTSTQNLPLRFHLNIGYYIDNSGNVVDYNAANTSAVSRYVSRFAYGISEDCF